MSARQPTVRLHPREPPASRSNEGTVGVVKRKGRRLLQAMSQKRSRTSGRRDAGRVQQAACPARRRCRRPAAPGGSAAGSRRRPPPPSRSPARAPCGWRRSRVERRVQQHRRAQAAMLRQPPEMRADVHVAVPGEQRPRRPPGRQVGEPVVDHRDRLHQRRVCLRVTACSASEKNAERNGSTREPSEVVPSGNRIRLSPAARRLAHLVALAARCWCAGGGR